MKTAFGLVDWIEGESRAVIWMGGWSTIGEAVALRKDSHSSFPSMIVEYDCDDHVGVLSRRARLSGRNDPYKDQTVEAYQMIGKPVAYYDALIMEALTA